LPFLALVLTHLSVAQASLPIDEEAWLPLQRLGAPFGDSAEDAPYEQINLVGNADNPVGHWWIDTTSVYVRIRLARSPASITLGGTFEGDFGTYGWGILVDTDDNPSDFEHLVAIDDSGLRLASWGEASLPGWTSEPGTIAIVDDVPMEETTPISDDLAKVTAADTSFGDTENAYLDLAIPRSWVGLGESSARARIALVTDFNRTTTGFEYDIAAEESAEELAAALSDPIGDDGDGDMLSLSDEIDVGTDPQNADTDGDGYPDGDEVLIYETDPLDPVDPDPSIDEDCDDVPDGVDTLVDPDADADGDGLSNSMEWACETDPCVADFDVDGDGINNEDEAACGGDPCVAEEDVDGDGISTADEISAGTDPCSIEESTDTGDESESDTGDESESESDTGDEPDPGGESDTGEEPVSETDEDCDGIADHADDEIVFTAGEDNDGDGIPNDLEIDICGTDPCQYDLDPDLDGLGNGREVDCGTNPCSPDSDSDGIWDNEEMEGDDCGPDTDGDGIIDALDPDAPVSSDPIKPKSGAAGYVGGMFTGGGCSHAPLQRSLLWVGLLAMLCTRRRMVGAGVLLVFFFSSEGFAQSVDTSQFQPSPQARTFVGLEDPARSNPGATAGLFIHHARDPLLYRVDDPQRQDIRVVGSLWSTDWTGGYRFGLWDLALQLPVHVYAAGDSFEKFGSLGDVALQAGATLVDRHTGPLGVGLSTRFSAPTGDDTNWLSTNTPTASTLLHLAMGSRVVVAAQMGLTLAKSQSMGDLTTGSQARWAAGTHLPVAERGWLSIELDGAHHVHALSQPGAHPVELRGFGRWELADKWLVTVGAATALSRGIGAPAMRLISGVSFTPQTHPHTVPTQAVANQTTALHISITDNEGQPVQTSAHIIEANLNVETNIDGIASLSLPTGTHTLRITTTGFAPIQRRLTLSKGGSTNIEVVLSPSRVEITGDQILIQDKIYFETGSADIQTTSHSLLDEVALVMLDNANLLLVEVQGHTDDIGSDSDNLNLSTGRAQAVRAYLIDAGVAAVRLRARGFGETTPLNNRITSEARTQNRRVEFHLIQSGPE
jgi:outer membrane protein OmpA-like peptidoglycan-associated protein